MYRKCHLSYDKKAYHTLHVGLLCLDYKYKDSRQHGRCFTGVANLYKDKITKAKGNQAKYRNLRKLPMAKSAVNTIGCGSGYNKSLMHHKFLVGLDENKKPTFVINGSFNFTKSAVNHLENCMVIEDESVAKLFKDEFMRLFPISRPLKL